MNKEQFDKLPIIEQINYINQSTGTLTTICQNINIGRSTISERFKKVGYIYSKELGQYYLSNTMVMEIHQPNLKVPRNQRESHITPYQTELIELAENKDALMEMLREYQRDTKVIDVPILDITTLPIELQTDIINKSIKLYQPVQELFDNLCNQYSSYKKQDLICLAYYEFVQKYKK